MAVKTQSHYYPAKTITETCYACYVSGESSDCRPAKGNSQNSSKACGTCNVICNSSQAYCNISKESISSHEDVGSFSGFNVSSTTDIICEKWTVSKWNELQDKYLTANNMGYTESQGEDIEFTRAVSKEPYTAASYNEFVSAASKFNSSISSVDVNDIIRVAHSTALETGFSKGKFDSSVCDICNVGGQHSCGYNCSCNYNCSYNCYYNCSYNCSHNCSHNCSSNKPAT